jgi:hypothetical protein
VARASLIPVGSAKFGSLVGGLVSPTLVGTRVHAARAQPVQRLSIAQDAVSTAASIR